MDRLGLARASLVGYSIGGRTAWIFAALHSERVDKLVPGARVAMLARMAQTVLVAPVPLLKRIQAPTLLVWGERDAMIPFANSADHLAALPNVRRVAIPGAAHVVQEEAADASVMAAVDFLDK